MNTKFSAIQSFMGFCLLLPVAVQADKFSIVVIPDTQMYVEEHPEIFEAQMDWVVANKAVENIIYVAHLGDLKDDLDCDVNVITAGTGNSRTEWEIVDDSLQKLDDNAIPFGVVPGNHDYDSINNNQSKGCPNFDTQRPLVGYNDILGPTRFTLQPHYDGIYGDSGANRAGNRQDGQMEDGEVLPVSNEDNFVLLEGSCGVKLIAINLGYHEAASQASDLPEVDWADMLLKTYDDRIGILTSHFFIDENPGIGQNGARNDYGSYGQQVRDRLEDNPNLMMMLSAHERGESWKIDDGTDQNPPDRLGMQPIHAMLSDYQSVNYLFRDGDAGTPEHEPTVANIDWEALDGSNKFGDAGFMRIMRYDTDTGDVSIETFAPPVSFAGLTYTDNPSEHTDHVHNTRTEALVSTHDPLLGTRMDRNTASSFSMSFLGYGSDPGVCPPSGGDPTTITFEGSPAPANDFITFTVAGLTTYTESGIEITPDVPDSAFFIDAGYNQAGSRLLNPTGVHLFYQNQTILFSITTSTGDGFSLTSFDSAAMYGSTTGADITVTGTFVGGGTITRDISLPHLDAIGNAFQNYTFDSSWSNLASVDVTRTSGNFVGFDNIIVVPDAP